MGIVPPSIMGYYPTQKFADHEILMSFNGDSHAEFFRVWWEKHGEKAFLKWANAQKKEE